jgi:P pilus assembly chaperone PapD
MKINKIYFLARFFCTLSFILAINFNANASSITPVAIEINDTVKVNSITYTNNSKFEVLVQANQKLWTQENGKDKYTETSDLLIVPSFVKIPAGQKQVFRVTKRDKNESQFKAYRLALEDVSEEVGDALTENQIANMRFRFDHNLPVYFYPSSAKKNSYKIPTISFCDEKIGTERQACLRIQNEESMHVKVEDILIKVQNQRTTIVPTFLTVLPKSYKDINISIPRVPQPVTIEAKTSFGPASITLPVQFTQKK